MYHHFTNNFKNYFLKNKFLFSLKNYKQHKRYKKSKQTNRKSNESYLSESHSVQRDFFNSTTSELQRCSNQLSLLMKDLYLYINTFDNTSDNTSDNNTFDSLYTSDTFSYKESYGYECHDIIDKYYI